jgi:hypothetical protein
MSGIVPINYHMQIGRAFIGFTSPDSIIGYVIREATISPSQEGIMKKLVFALALAACAAALSAQALGPGSQQDKMPNMLPQGSPSAAPMNRVTVSGILTFVDDRPAIKTDTATVLLEMPDFFEYAYTDGIKAGATIKVVGALMTPPPAPADKVQASAAGQPDTKAAAANASVPLAVIDAQEVMIGSRTYVIVPGNDREAKVIRK